MNGPSCPEGALGKAPGEKFISRTLPMPAYRKTEKRVQADHILDPPRLPYETGRALAAVKLIVAPAVSVHGATIVSHAVTVEVRPAEVFGPQSIGPALAPPVLFVPVQRIERTGSAEKRQGVVMLQQTEHTHGAGADGDVAPFIFCVLSMAGQPIAPLRIVPASITVAIIAAVSAVIVTVVTVVSIICIIAPVAVVAMIPIGVIITPVAVTMAAMVLIIPVITVLRVGR